jgi:two-component system, NarL family, sensor histidine kinase DevS
VPGNLDRTLLAHAVELAPDGVLIVDHDGRIVYANRSICTLVGADDLVGRNVDELVPSRIRGSHAAMRQSYNDRPTQRPMGVGLELGLERRDGTNVPVEISLSPFEHGESFVIVAVRDISDRLESQRRLNMAHEQLALVGERERIGRDLHDVVLQHLYGMGLSAQAIAARAAARSDTDTATRLEAVVDDVDRIISEVRTIVFTLGPGGRRAHWARSSPTSSPRPPGCSASPRRLRIEGPVESGGQQRRAHRDGRQRCARRSATSPATPKATQAAVVIEIIEDQVVMRVTDNGVGPPPDLARAYSGGHGLANLRSRAASLRGSCALTAGPDGGSVLIWNVPFS